MNGWNKRFANRPPRPTASPAFERPGGAEEIPEEPVGELVDWTQSTSGSFEEMGLPPSVLAGVSSLGYTAPTPVQSAVFEAAMAGRDLVVQSKTGSGKTAAFGVPVAARLAPPTGKVQALILAPTRELVQQVEREVTVFSREAGHETVVVIGGLAYGPQNEALSRGASVVVGTPGRVLDHLRRHSFDASGVRMVVLDEADEMLSMGFWEEVTAILDHMPAQRQTLLFSATLPPEIERAAKAYLRDPARIELTGDVATVLSVENVLYYPIDGLTSSRNLLYLLEAERPRSTLVFCNTKAESSGVAVYLERFGFRVDVIHGDLSQRERERAMGRLRAVEIDILVATDIAARGIDISDLSHVVNHGLPDQPEVYVHRVGRTGRIGKKGTALTLLRGTDTHIVSAVHKRYGVDFETRSFPTQEEIIRMQTERIVALLLERIEGVETEMYAPIAEELSRTEEGRRAIALLLRSYFDAQGGRSATKSAPTRGARLYLACPSDEGSDEDIVAAATAIEGVTAADILKVERQATCTFLTVSEGAAELLLAGDAVLCHEGWRWAVEKAREARRPPRSRSGSSGSSAGGARRRR